MDHHGITKRGFSTDRGITWYRSEPDGITLATMGDETYTVQRSATIDAPPARVYDQIVDFHNWTNWSPWEDLDPELQRTYSGAFAGTGAVYRWSGNRKAGQGRMEITDAAEPSRVRIDLVFESRGRRAATPCSPSNRRDQVPALPG